MVSRFMPFQGQDPRAPLPTRYVAERPPVRSLYAPMAPNAAAALPRMNQADAMPPMSGQQSPRSGGQTPAVSPQMADAAMSILAPPYVGPREGLLGPPQPAGQKQQENTGLFGTGVNPLVALGLALSAAGDLTSEDGGNLDSALASLQQMREQKMQEMLFQAKMAEAQNKAEQYEIYNGPDGKPIAQVNLRTGKMEPLPDTFGGGKVDPPELETLFDEDTGREYKARWDPASGQYVRVGGLKAGAKGEAIRGVEMDGLLVNPVTGAVIADFRGEGGDPGIVTDPKDRAKMEDDLRDDYTKAISGFDEVERAYFAMNNLADDQTGASDIALIVNFFKTIDPTSTVREGEFASAAGAMGLGDRFVTQMQKLDNGQFLTPAARQEFVNVGKDYFGQWSEKIDLYSNRLGEIAKRRGLTVDNVVYDPRRERKTDPAAGDVPPPPAGFQMLE